MTPAVTLLEQSGQRLGLDSETMDHLMHPDLVDRTVATEPLPDGTSAEHVGYRTQYLVGDDGSQGGYRVVPYAEGQAPSEQELREHSIELGAIMTAKIGLVQEGLRLATNHGWVKAFKLGNVGGAKGVVAVPAHLMDPNNRELFQHVVLEGYVDSHLARIKKGDGTGPDANVRPDDMGYMAEHLVQVTHNSRMRHLVTCKPNGLPGRETATSDSMAFSMSHLLDRNVVQLSDYRVVIQGYGNVGQNLHEEFTFEPGLIDHGLRVAGVSDQHRAVLAYPGQVLLPEDIHSDRGVITRFNEEKAHQIPRDDLLTAEAGVLALAGVGMSITPANDRAVEAEMVIVANNGAIHPSSLEHLAGQGTVVSSEVHASLGGVAGSLIERNIEQIKMMYGGHLNPRIVRQIIQGVTYGAGDRILEQAHGDPTQLVHAAYDLGVQHQYAA